MTKTYKPGQTAPVSGQYKNTTTKTEVTTIKGEKLPPTPKSGHEYVISDNTKHKK
jgi:hypothetical protein